MAGTEQQVVPGNAAKIAAIAPNQNMYRVEGGGANAGSGSQPAPATPNVISWMGTIGHLAPGPGTADQQFGGDAVEAEVHGND